VWGTAATAGAIAFEARLFFSGEVELRALCVGVSLGRPITPAPPCGVGYLRIWNDLPWAGCLTGEAYRLKRPTTFKLTSPMAFALRPAIMELKSHEQSTAQDQAWRNRALGRSP